MKYNEYTIPVEQVVDEAPMGLIKQGVTKLASKIPGSIGAKATGALQTGGNANAMYKEFYTYLGQKGLKPTTASISAFLKTKGVSDAIIKQHVSAAASGGAAKYPQGGGGGAPAASGGAAPAQAAAPAKGAGFNVKLPQKGSEPAADTKQSGFKTDLRNLPPRSPAATPVPQNDPAAQTPAPQQTTAPATQKLDWAAQRKADWERTNDKRGGGIEPSGENESVRLSESQKLQRLLAKISKRL